MRARIPLAAFTLLLVSSPSTSLSAQTAGSVSVALSTDSVQMGEVFEMRLSLPVPANSIVYFPDTLPATVNVESASPVRVEGAATATGGAVLLLTYEMMAFGVGTLPVPGFDILMTPRGDRDGVLELPGGSVSGAWDDAPQPTDARLVRIPRQAVWVVPVFTPGELVSGVEPMPPDDVAGGNWSWPALTILLLCSSLLAVALVSTTMGVLEHLGGHTPSSPPTAEELRQRALDKLDALLAHGDHLEGRQLAFYTRGSDIVRRYLEGIDGSRGSSLTSSELMRRLGAESGSNAVSGLATEMGLAEVVKFGRLRPDADTSERHWRALRDWVAASEGGTR